MTDARGLNAMNEQTRIGHAYLTRWAQAVKKDNPQPWPSITLLGRVIEEGPHGAPSGMRPVGTLSEDMAAVDALVAQMRGDVRVAVLAYYGKWDTVENVANGLNWSQEHLSRALRIAREAIAIGVAARLRQAS